MAAVAVAVVYLVLPHFHSIAVTQHSVVEPEDSVSGPGLMAPRSVELAQHFAVGPERLIAEPHFAVD